LKFQKLAGHINCPEKKCFWLRQSVGRRKGITYMVDSFKFARGVRRWDETIPAALREFIESAIVPALVKEYLAEREATNVLVLPDVAVANLPTMQFSPCEVSR
jgi:hypothetical protein